MERLSVESFYVVGGTLARDAPCYVEREADKRLLAALQQSEICYVLTSRQMGKSSLMVRTAVRLREAGTSVAVLDLTSLGQNLTAMQWYNGLLERTGQQLALEDKIEDSWTRSEHLGPFQRWVQAMRQVVLPSCPGRVVIFIDEIDTVRSLPFPTDEFFAGIRELYNRRSEEPDLRRLTFCLLGVATPADLIRDTRTTPFNVGRRIELSDFSGEEASPLALGMGGEASVGERLLKRILYWTGGHPYLTQRLCQAVSEAKLDSSNSVDEVCTDLFLSSRARQRDDNLLFVRDRMLRSEVDTAGLLSLYDKVRAGKRVHDDEADPLIGVLRLSGITRIEQGHLKVRNRIYERVFDQEWIISNLPGSELRRQRAAYKKGFKRAALASAVLVLVLGGLIGGYLYRASMELAPSDLAMHVPVPVFWLAGSLLAQKDVGSLLVKAGDENVMVFINNQPLGGTNKNGELLVPGLHVGAYNIRIEKPGFQTVSTPGVAIFANNESHLNLQLQRLVTSGTLKITDALPGTTVHLDGNYAGETDASGSLSVPASPGDHNLELAKDGYISGRLTQRVTLGGTDTVNGKLNPDQELLDWRGVSSSKNPEVFQAFLKKNPDSRFASEARRNAQNLEWNRIKDLGEPEQFDAFVKRYPDSPFAADARTKMNQLMKEREDYRSVSNSNNPADLEAFLSTYPNGALAPRVRQQLMILQDRRAIVEIIQKYQEAYGRKDVDAIVRLWPTCPERKKKTLNYIFTKGQSETLTLQAEGQPDIAADHAHVVCDLTRVSAGNSLTTRVEINLVKSSGSWFIEGGTL